MITLIRLWTILLVFLLCVACVASVPGMMPYQGKLTNNAGQALSDGTYSMTLSLYAQEAGGAALWTESKSVQVTGGVFSVLLGSTTEMPASAFQGATWLETQVNGGVLGPRTRIVSAGYAMLSKTAETVPDGSITAAKIAPGAVGTSAILDGNVFSQDLADASVTGKKLQDNSVTSAKITDASIATNDLMDLMVTTNKIAAGAVNVSKLASDTKLMFNVRDYGAVGNGAMDDAIAFQNALNAASAAGGGIVWVPTGTYMIGSHLTIPSYVTLEGVFRAPAGSYTGNHGTTLLAVEGQGNENGVPFIEMDPKSTIKGISVFYPQQSATAPVAYPWCIRGNIDNCTVLDVLLVNPWQGVDFGTNACGRHMIRRLYGQPIKTGLYINRVLDVGRVEDVHFWPFWQASGPVADYSAANGTAFKIQRADWEFMSGCFASGYNVGFQFIALLDDPLWGLPDALLTNSGADNCATALRVDNCYDTWGNHFANCQFFGLVDIKSTNHGYVKFENCGFRAQPSSGHCVKTAGPGAVILTGCHFSNYDANNQGNAAIYDDGSRLTVNGCDFYQSGKKQLTITASNPYTVVLIGNTYRGGRNIEKLSTSVQLIEAGNATR